MFSMNIYQRSRMQGRWAQYAASDQLRPLILEWSSQESNLIRKRDQYGLTIMEEKQLEHSREIGLALQRLSTITNFGMGGHYNRYYENFLVNLDKYSRFGGEFTALEGVDREVAWALHRWRDEHDLTNEFEEFPITQHLFLKQSASMLLNILGLAILVIFFGSSITEEKERKTWQTLKTQPLSRLKLIMAKYCISMLMVVVFIMMVTVISLLIPFLLNGWTLTLDHPQILRTKDSFTIISTGEYLLRNFMLFFCASSVIISLTFLVSKWIHKSINLYFTVGVGLGIGYFLTSGIHHPLNPFYFLKIKDILTSLPVHEPWIYLVTTVIWTTVLIALSIALPEHENKVELSSNKSKQFASGNTNLNKKAFSNLLVFELRKIRRDGAVKILLGAMLIVIIVGHFFLTNITKQRETDYLTELQFRLNYDEDLIVRYQDWIVDLEKENTQILDSAHDRDLRSSEQAQIAGNEDLIERIKEAIINREIQHEKLEAAIAAYHVGDWPTFHQYQLFINQRAYDITYPSGEQQNSRVTLGRFTKLVSIDEKHWLIERNIQPVLSGEFINTIHEFWGLNTRIGWRGEQVRQEQWIFENTKIDNSGLFYLYLSYKNYLYFIPLLLLVFFLGGGISREKGKKPTLNLLKTQPLSEEKIFVAKAINGFLVSTLIILLLVTIIITVGTILNRFGDWDYPILHYNSYQETISDEYIGLAAGGYGYHFITLGKYLLNTTLLLIALNIFIISLANLLSTFLKRTMAILSSTVLMLVGGYWLTIKNPYQISHLSPFSYVNIPQIVNGEMATRLNNPSFNVKTGIMILMVLSIGFTILGYLVVNSKKYIAISNKFKTPRDTVNKSILVVEDIKKSYGKQEVLKGISFEMEEPKILALVGPNGAGKSTLLNIITNILTPDSGEVKILGISNKNPEIYNDISFMQDNSILYDYLTGYDHLQFMAEVRLISKEQVLRTAERIGITSYMHKKVAKYSLGMKQHLLLAMAVLNKPTLLILDEPLNGLDPSNAIKVRELLQDLHRSGTGILLSSHNLAEIDRLTSNILFIKDGNIIKEDISIYERTGYLLTVDDIEKAQNMLIEENIEVQTIDEKLLVFPSELTIHRIISLMNEKGIELLDMEKQILGSEDRYKKLYPEVSQCS